MHSINYLLRREAISWTPKSRDIKNAKSRLPKTSEEKKVHENEGIKSINSIYLILNCSEDVRGVDVTQDLNLHPINTVPEYCRLWPALPNACEELMKISNDYSQEWIFSHIQKKTISPKRFQLLFYFWVKCLRRSGSWKS